MDTNALAARIVTAFLEPALATTDWREKWKGVNRAAGVIAGWSMASGSAAVTAEAVLHAVECLFPAVRSGPSVKNVDLGRQLTDGLRKRVAEILVLMGN